MKLFKPLKQFNTYKRFTEQVVLSEETFSEKAKEAQITVSLWTDKNTSYSFDLSEADIHHFYSELKYCMRKSKASFRKKIKKKTSSY